MPYPINPLDPSCQFIGWDRIRRGDLNWEDGIEYYNGPMGAIGKLAAMALFPPSAYVFGSVNFAQGYVRYRDEPTFCNGAVVVLDGVFLFLPVGTSIRGVGGGGAASGGVAVLNSAQLQALSQQVSTLGIGIGEVRETVFRMSSDPSGENPSTRRLQRSDFKRVYRNPDVGNDGRIEMQGPVDPKFEIPPHEQRDILQLLSRKTNFWVYRVRQDVLAGDYVIIDKSNPNMQRGWVIELKSQSGAGSSNQLTQNRVNQASRVFGANLEHRSGTMEEFLQSLP